MPHFSLKNHRVDKALRAALIVAVLLLEIPEKVPAHPYGGGAPMEFQQEMMPSMRIRERRSLASGRWGLRPGKRSSMGGTPEYLEDNADDGTLSWIFYRDAQHRPETAYLVTA